MQREQEHAVYFISVIFLPSGYNPLGIYPRPMWRKKINIRLRECRETPITTATATATPLIYSP